MREACIFSSKCSALFNISVDTQVKRLYAYALGTNIFLVINTRQNNPNTF